MSKKNQFTATNKTMVMNHQPAEPVFKKAEPPKPAPGGKKEVEPNKGGNTK